MQVLVELVYPRDSLWLKLRIVFLAFCRWSYIFFLEKKKIFYYFKSNDNLKILDWVKNISISYQELLIVDFWRLTPSYCSSDASSSLLGVINGFSIFAVCTTLGVFIRLIRIVNSRWDAKDLSFDLFFEWLDNVEVLWVEFLLEPFPFVEVTDEDAFDFDSVKFGSAATNICGCPDAHCLIRAFDHTNCVCSPCYTFLLCRKSASFDCLERSKANYTASIPSNRLYLLLFCSFQQMNKVKNWWYWRIYSVYFWKNVFTPAILVTPNMSIQIAQREGGICDAWLVDGNFCSAFWAGNAQFPKTTWH